MAFKRTIDREKVKEKLALIGKKIDEDTDPRLLNEYRVLFKGGVSFFRRSWAAAYLLMLYDQGTGGASPRPRPGNGGREGRKAPDRPESFARREGGENPRPAGPRPFLAEDESRRLFISVGRNRRVFPREILGLIITRAQVAREDIGTIRILDSYSFVQVRDTVADTIIEALNGAMFRGRPITANYARLKREEGQDGVGSPESSQDPGETDDPETGGQEAPAGETVEESPGPGDSPGLEEDPGCSGGSDEDDDPDNEEGV
jgi:hypothetical protein